MRCGLFGEPVSLGNCNLVHALLYVVSCYPCAVMAEDQGLRVVLSPVQLAAVLQGEHISSHEMMMNRLWGGAKIIGGALELVGGGALLLMPEPTTLTKVGGVVLAAHGTDTFGTGIREVWTGEPTKTLTQQAGESVARGMGANEKQAERAGIVLDVAVPLAVAAVTTAVRVMSVRAGRIALAEHEALGGHTILKHVGRTEAQLRTRLLAEANIPAASSFPSLRVAETVISDAMKARAPLVRAWASSANQGSKYVWVHNAAKTIGYGVVRQSGVITNMQKVLIVLKPTQVSGKLYFILTAYPIP